MPPMPTSSRPRRLRRTLIAAGALLIAAAAWGAAGGVERLVGVPAETLSWGLGLFCLLLTAHGLVLVFAGRRGLGDGGSAKRRKQQRGRRQPLGRGELVALVTITLAALVLRLWHLDSGLWHDEIGTLLEFVRPDPGTILTSFRNQNQHMLYSLTAHASIRILGESAASLRLPAALFGVACVPALHLFARKVASVREALLAAALMASSYHHIWFSQNARGYTGVLLFTLLATWAWLAALERNDWRSWLSYVAAVALGMWVHLTMTFVIAAHGLVFLTLVLRDHIAARADGSSRAAVLEPGRGFAAFALCVTTTAQLYALGLPAFFSSALHEVSLDSEWISPLWLVTETVRGLAAGFSGPLLAVGGIAAVAGGILLLAGWLGICRLHAPLAIVMVLPGVLVVGLMIVLRHNLWPRFLFFCAGFALIVVVRGAFDLAPWVARRLSWPPPRGQALATAAVVVLIALSLASLPRYYALPKQDYVGAMEFVDERLSPDGVAVAVGLARLAYEELYAVNRPRWTGTDNADELDALRHRHAELWLVYSLPTHLSRWHPEIWQMLGSDFEIVRVFPGSLRGGEVHVLRSRAEVAAGLPPPSL